MAQETSFITLENLMKWNTLEILLYNLKKLEISLKYLMMWWEISISQYFEILKSCSKGQAKVEIIIPNPVEFQSSPLLPLNIQRKIDAVDITIWISVNYFSLNTQGLD